MNPFDLQLKIRSNISIKSLLIELLL